MNEDTAYSVSQFIAVTNQILETALPFVYVEGEVSNYSVRSEKWVSFRLKDEESIVECFASVWQLNMPLEDGMQVVVAGRPRLSPKWGKFSISFQQVTPKGEGSIAKALLLLRNKLEAEGLFDYQRKRPLPAYPERIGVVCSLQADGYQDFITISGQRWPVAEYFVAHTQVQGDVAPEQIVSAIESLNQQAQPLDVIAVVRGGGSKEDLLAFSDERVVRAVAGSRVPIVVGVGHENDECIAQLAADKAAATPTHAAQLITPAISDVQGLLSSSLRTFMQAFTQQKGRIKSHKESLQSGFIRQLRASSQRLQLMEAQLINGFNSVVTVTKRDIESYKAVLRVQNPEFVLKRGYGIVRDASGKPLTRASQLDTNKAVTIQMFDGKKGARIT